MDTKKAVPFDKLLQAVALGNVEPEVLSSVAARLARLERGTFPFWLDAQTYGYLQPLRPTNQRGILQSESVIALGRITPEEQDAHPPTHSAAEILAAVPPTT